MQSAFGAFFLTSTMALAFNGSDIAGGIMETIDAFIQHNVTALDAINIFQMAFYIDTIATLAYGVVAWVAEEFVFAEQAGQTAAYWSNPPNLSSRAGWFGFGVALLGTLLTGLTLILAGNPATAGFCWVVGALAIGFDTALFQLVPRVDNYIDQEDNVFGYKPSY